MTTGIVPTMICFAVVPSGWRWKEANCDVAKEAFEQEHDVLAKVPVHGQKCAELDDDRERIFLQLLARLAQQFLSDE